MQKKLEIKDRKGAISLFVLLSALFFLAIVTAVSVSVRNKESRIDNQLNKIKNSYEVNVGNEGTIYGKKIAQREKDNIVYAENELRYDGTYFTDTKIKLFNKENIEKDFEITFTFSEELRSNKNLATLLNSIDESNNKSPGFTVRIEGNGIKVVGGKGRAISDYAGKKFKIIRKSEIIYTSINDEEPVMLMDNPSTPFETTVVFGCCVKYDNNGNAYQHDNRFYNGDVFDVSIRIYDPETIVSKATQLVYSKDILEAKNKKVNNQYINTGIKLFDEENWGKDFEVSFNIDKVDSNNEKQATLFNSLKEAAPYPGVLLRIENNQFRLEGSYKEEGSSKNETKEHYT